MSGFGLAVRRYAGGGGGGGGSFVFFSGGGYVGATVGRGYRGDGGGGGGVGVGSEGGQLTLFECIVLGVSSWRMNVR